MASEAMTNQQVNEALARAIGWTLYGVRWEKETAVAWEFRWKAPDYFEPVASAELEDWLHAQGILAVHCVEEKYVAVRLSSWRPLPKFDRVLEAVDLDGMTPAAARRRALALAAHAALCQPEVPRAE
jgi:hypothetical protein